MHRVSIQYHHVLNLVNVAKHHKEYCNEPACGVSLGMLYDTAVVVMKEIKSDSELVEATKLIAEMPRY